MRRKFTVIQSLAALATLSLAIVSCGIGLEPASSAGNTELSLRLGGAAAMMSRSAADRAVFSGDGYIYIRLGGVASGGQRLYGPYSATTGETFSTTEIPAGTYSFMAILYASQKIDGLTYMGASENTYSVSDVFQADDATFLTATDDNFETAFEEATCGKIMYGVTLVAGRNNAITAVMDPLTVYVCSADFMYQTWSPLSLGSPSSATTLVRRFVRIEGISSMNAVITGYVPNFYTQLTTSSSNFTLVRAAFFDGNGVTSTVGYSPGTYDYLGTAITYGNTGDDTNYLYLEYYASAPIAFTPSFSD